jgi:hypothetical protein
MGMVDHVVDSVLDLLASDSETLSDFGSSEGSHHPSCECFMVQEGQRTPDGHVTDASDSGETPQEVPSYGMPLAESASPQLGMPP